ncbi:MAG: PEP/pyruvate-binding domain-containing protein [Bacteroidota bacterium]
MLRNKLPNLSTYDFTDVSYKNLMQNRIYNVLIVCSSYDFYLLEEDGRIDELIFEEYTALNLRYPPNIMHATSEVSAKSIMGMDSIDLVIVWLDTAQRSIKISNKIKKDFPFIPIVALSHYPEELKKLLDKKDTSNIDFVFHWNGNINIFIAVIKLVEDRINAKKDILQIGVKAILLVEDSIRFYSRYLPLIYKILFNQTKLFTQDGLNEHRKIMSKRGRPKVLLATTYEEGIELFQEYKENLLGVISDVTYMRNGKKDKEAGFHLLKYVREYHRYFPVLIESSEAKNEKRAIELKAKFLNKDSETLGLDIKKYITRYFSFGEFEFWDPDKMEISKRARNLKSFQKALFEVPLSSIVYHAKRNEFSKWLKSRALFPLAKLFSKVEFEDFTEEDHVREFLISAVKAFRLFRSRGIIAKFEKDQYDEYLIFSRIGEGSLGGKGRGLAFIDVFLKRRRLFNKYKGISISIPRTVVLSTEVFDEFMEQHDLWPVVANTQNDEDILNAFITKSLSNWVIEDIKVFLKTIKTPVAIRSSNVLEDSLYQPFAGIYATYMVPNTNLNDLIKMVCSAIKSVMASAFYKNSKAYIKATSHAIEESKMAVILQEVIGKQYEDVYYPNISGVARSTNFYPISDEKRNEGIANIALGLGEIIVGGGRTLRFSPYHPKKILQLSSTATTLKETQKYFYGLDMNPHSYHFSINEDVNKKKLNLRQAKDHKSLKFVASTYDLQNNRVRPGVFHEGPRVITFDNILKYDSFPLAEILKNLLRVGKKEIGHPIEMEFAVKLDVPPGECIEFSFLQIRPIVEYNDNYKQFIPEEVNTSDTIIYAESALGNGKYEDIYDFVYVKPESFNPAKTRDIVNSIEKLNNEFEKKDKKYILVGPGRWGSSDPWLGIPVNWLQVSSAKIIVESGLENFRIDPSQGTHFFQNITSFKVGYLTLNPFMNDGFLDIDYLNSQDAVFEDEYVRHIRFKEPLTIVIDGKNSKAVIYKEGFVIKNTDDIEIDELPPSGFF